MPGVYKPFWLSRCTITRLAESGVDPTSLLPLRAALVIFENEACDLSTTSRTIATRTDAGTVLTRVWSTVLRIDPDDQSIMPEENDDVVIDGVRGYKIEAILEEDIDPATGSPLGAAYFLSTPQTAQ